MKILVTGGAGFIGSNLLRHLAALGHSVLNVDSLTYAGTLRSLDGLDNTRCRHAFIDITHSAEVKKEFAEFKPDWVVHLAAESHVDRSIDDAGSFIQTNVIGTFTLLQAAREHYEALSPEKRKIFRFLHVSTDEVFGSLPENGFFHEGSRYDPRSPYSASKAASDHLVKAWFHTYGLPTIVTNCSNNYGPFQNPEKLIPLVILKAIHGSPIPVYGKGDNIRDWLHVDDHARALIRVLEAGTCGETYNVGGGNEWRNIDLARSLCGILDALRPTASRRSYAEQITFVSDRPGHDKRYAIDSSKIQRELGWRPSWSAEAGFAATVRWYLDRQDWWQPILNQAHPLSRRGIRSSGDLSLPSFPSLSQSALT